MILSEQSPNASVEALNMIRMYGLCKLGTQGMSFNWMPVGDYHETPAIVIAAFQVIDNEINAFQQKQIKEQQEEIKRRGT